MGVLHIALHAAADASGSSVHCTSPCADASHIRTGTEHLSWQRARAHASATTVPFDTMLREPD